MPKSQIPGLFVVSGLAGTGQFAAPTPAPEVAQVQLRAVNHRFIDTVSDPGGALIEALTHTDLLATRSDGAWLSRADFIAQMQGRPAAQAAPAQDEPVRLFGPLALVHGVAMSAASRVRYTDVYLWGGTGWRLVSAQDTLLPEGSSSARVEGLAPPCPAWQGQDPTGNDVAVLTALNERYVSSFREADIAWYDAHLAPDYVVISSDGSYNDRAAALAHFALPTFADSMKSFPVEGVQVTIASKCRSMKTPGPSPWALGHQPADFGKLKRRRLRRYFELPPPPGAHMPDSPPYAPPKIWTWNKESGGRFASINRPIAGATHDKELPVGRHPLQLYSLGTPNGVKVTVMLEELLALGHTGAQYDAWLIRINSGEQFGSGFVAVNPNSKIPALLDRSDPQHPVRVFESGAMLLYLAERFGGAFVPPVGDARRAECLSWLFWQMGSGPYLGGGFGHFYAYAPSKMEYSIDRFAMEVKRQLDVLNRRLAESEYLAGDDYTVADMAVWPWYGTLAKGQLYEAGEFLQVHEYTHVLRWTDQIAQRPAVKRGRMVNRTWGQPSSQLHERHEASDFDTKTQDKVAAAG